MTSPGALARHVLRILLAPPIDADRVLGDDDRDDHHGDAWFDVLTSRGHVEQTSAIVLATVGEIPLTIVSFWWARRILRALDDAIPQLRSEGWRLHHGRLVPPATDRPLDT